MIRNMDTHYRKLSKWLTTIKTDALRPTRPITGIPEGKTALHVALL